MDGHERAKDYLTPGEVKALLDAAKAGRHGERDHLRLMMMFRHRLRVSEATSSRRDELDLERARLWVRRLKGGLSVEQPIPGDELRAGLQGVHPHTLRHSCGFCLADKEAELRTTQDYLGHRDPKHTVHYTRTTGQRFEGLWR